MVGFWLMADTKRLYTMRVVSYSVLSSCKWEKRYEKRGPSSRGKGVRRRVRAEGTATKRIQTWDCNKMPALSGKAPAAPPCLAAPPSPPQRWRWPPGTSPAPWWCLQHQRARKAEAIPEEVQAAVLKNHRNVRCCHSAGSMNGSECTCALQHAASCFAWSKAMIHSRLPLHAANGMTSNGGRLPACQHQNRAPAMVAKMLSRMSRCSWDRPFSPMMTSMFS